MFIGTAVTFESALRRSAMLPAVNFDPGFAPLERGGFWQPGRSINITSLRDGKRLESLGKTEEVVGLLRRENDDQFGYALLVRAGGRGRTVDSHALKAACNSLKISGF